MCRLSSVGTALFVSFVMASVADGVTLQPGDIVVGAILKLREAPPTPCWKSIPRPAIGPSFRTTQREAAHRSIMAARDPTAI